MIIMPRLSSVPPTGLEILEKPTYVSEGKSRLVTCQATGGYPPPEISWWIGTRQLQPQQSVSSLSLSLSLSLSECLVSLCNLSAVLGEKNKAI